MANLPRIGPQLPACSLEECRIAIVGEAPGRTEVEHNPPMPFVGRAGQLLDNMLYEAGIDRSLCYVTNVFLLRPPENKVSHFFLSRMAAKIKNEEICDDLPPFNSNAYLRKQFLPEMERLMTEMDTLRPQVVIPLGATALWAFTGQKGITTEHGKIYESHLVPTMSVVPTYHPAYILRNSNKKTEMIDDLKLAQSLLEADDG